MGEKLGHRHKNNVGAAVGRGAAAKTSGRCRHKLIYFPCYTNSEISDKEQRCLKREDVGISFLSCDNFDNFGLMLFSDRQSGV